MVFALSDCFWNVRERDNKPAFRLRCKNNWIIKHRLLSFQAKLLLDAFNSASLQLDSVHGKYRLLAVKEYLQMRALALNKRCTLFGEPALEFVRVHARMLNTSVIFVKPLNTSRRALKESLRSA